MSHVISRATAEPAPPEQEPGLFTVMRTTRTMRRLRPDPVPQETLERLVEAATWAPTPQNTQDRHFVVVTDREQLARLAPWWRRAVELYDATSVPGLEDALGERAATTIRDLAADLEQVPALIAVCHRISPLSGAGKPGARRAGLRILGWRRMARFVLAMPRTLTLHDAGGAWPAVQNLLLAARGLGLGASVFQLHLLVERDFARVLGVPDDMRIMAIVAVGQPRGHFGPVRRRPVAEVLHRDRW